MTTALKFKEDSRIDDPLVMLRDTNNNKKFDSNEIFYYTKDHLGSIREILDHEGKLVQRYDYSAYGVTKIAKRDATSAQTKLVENPYAYTGRELMEETGDYYYRARFYKPGIQTFLSEDPIGFISGDTNFYRYVKNNPIILIDPDGLFTVFAGGGAAAGIGDGSKQGKEVNMVSGSAGFAVGSSDSGGVNIGTFGTTGAGNIAGGVAGAGFVAGFSTGSVESLRGKGSSVGINILGVSLEVLFNPKGAFYGAQIGAGGKGVGLGAFGTVTNTSVVIPKKRKTSCGSN